jgi:predicted XRE-type DNA-binding protein
MPNDLLVSNDDVLSDDLQDPAFREQWEKAAIARWLAIELSHFRAKNDLSQRELADRLGLHQPDIARMEKGIHTPTLEKLIKVVIALGLELMIDILPDGAEAKLSRKGAGKQAVITMGGAKVVLATA